MAKSSGKSTSNLKGYVVARGMAGAIVYAKQGGWKDVEELKKDFDLLDGDIQETWFDVAQALAVGASPQQIVGPFYIEKGMLFVNQGESYFLEPVFILKKSLTARSGWVEAEMFEDVTT